MVIEANDAASWSWDDWPTAAAERLAKIDEALAKPVLAMSITTLDDLFDIDSVCVTAGRPTDFQDYPELAIRIRGALGRVLHALGPPAFARRHSVARPRAWDVLFEPRGPARTAKPMTVDADVRGDLIHVCVHLFGSAGFWLPDVASALVGALESGVAIQERSRHKAPLDVLDLRYERRRLSERCASAPTHARLKFLTPLILRRGDAARIEGRSLLIACLNRVARVAPWQNARLVADWNDLHQGTHAIDFDHSGMLPYGAMRGSRRAQRALPVVGALGHIVMRGPLTPFAPYLQLCELTHVGSQAALGFGRFALAMC